LKRVVRFNTFDVMILHLIWNFNMATSIPKLT